MYRVELKVESLLSVLELFSNLFLMYRVELKGSWKSKPHSSFHRVPNVPCGVERLIECSL